MTADVAVTRFRGGCVFVGLSTIVIHVCSICFKMHGNVS